ncbi:MAG: hypothetical protein ABFR89_06005 [Actinomycetota bacterium]
MSTSLSQPKPLGKPRWSRAVAIAASAAVVMLAAVGSVVWLARGTIGETIDSAPRIPESWTTWTGADGLVSDCLCQMVMLDDGSIWVVGFDGISRFDGTQWGRLDPPRPFAGEGWPNVVPAEDGSVWISGMDYVAQYADGAWGPVIEAGYGMDEGDPLAFQGLWIDDDGRVWTNLNDEDGVLKDGAFVPMPVPEVPKDSGFTPPEGVGILATAPNGSIWMSMGDSIAGIDGALIEYDGEQFVSYDLGGVREAVFEADGTGWFLVNEVSEDAWMFGQAQWSDPGLYRFEDGAWYRITTDDGLAGYRLGGMLHASDGSLWLSTVDGTVTRYQPGTDPKSGSAVSIDNWSLTDADWPPPTIYPPTTNA